MSSGVTEYWYANRLFFCDVTLKGKQKTARELATKGVELDTIVELLGVSRRSLQRWLANDKDSSVPEPIAITGEIVIDSDTIPVDPDKGQPENLHQKVLELFQNGVQPDAISQQLRVSPRTVERWLSNNSPQEVQKLISSLPAELQSLFVSQVPGTPFWVENVEETLREHWECHREIRLKLALILGKQLDLPEPNVRAVQAYSQALTRHTTAEREALSLEWVDVNRAITLLQAYGLSTINVSQLETLKLQRQNPISPSTTS